MSYDVIVIGAGHNGLVASAVLARAGYSTLVLERRATVGGAAVSALAHSMPPVHPAVTRAIGLDGLPWIRPEIPLTAIDAAERAVPFYADHGRTSEALAASAPKDAARYPTFVAQVPAAAAVVAAVLARRAPDMDAPTFQDLMMLGGAARKFRALDRRVAFGLLRWGPMPIADFVEEWFDDPLLRAAIAARGIFGGMLGPRSAGSTLTYLYQLAFDPHPLGSGLTLAGGMSAFTDALARTAQAAGAIIRVSSDVRRIEVDGNDAVSGVTLESGETIPCRAVLSAAGPKRTLLDLVEPGVIAPDTITRTRNIRARGVTAKVNLSLDSAPVFPALASLPAALQGRLHVGPTVDYLERAFDAAKYGEMSAEPWLEIAVPSAHAGTDASGRHALSIYAQYMPRHLRGASWSDEKAELLTRVMNVLDTVAPGTRGRVVASEVITPDDLEVEYGMDGGHIHHGEHTLDQMLIARPLLGLSGHAGPLEGLFLGSAGSHPGGGITGMPGLLAAEDLRRSVKRRP